MGQESSVPEQNSIPAAGDNIINTPATPGEGFQRENGTSMRMPNPPQPPYRQQYIDQQQAYNQKYQPMPDRHQPTMPPHPPSTGHDMHYAASKYHSQQPPSKPANLEQHAQPSTASSFYPLHPEPLSSSSTPNNGLNNREMNNGHRYQQPHPYHNHENDQQHPQKQQYYQHPQHQHQQEQHQNYRQQHQQKQKNYHHQQQQQQQQQYHQEHEHYQQQEYQQHQPQQQQHPPPPHHPQPSPQYYHPSPAQPSTHSSYTPAKQPPPPARPNVDALIYHPTIPNLASLSIHPRSDSADWRQKWDADDKSSSSDDDKLPATAGGMSGAPSHHFRPSMDGAHSSSSPVKRVGGISVGGCGGAEENVLSQQADKVLREQWDTGDGGTGGVKSEKPSVDMFFPLLRVLGKGSFGKVVLVRKRSGKESGGLFAMKILRKAHLVKRRQIERTKTERKVLSVVDHPFIMKLHFAFQTDEKLYLVLDYCPGGELFFHLSRYRRFPERVARFYAAELLLAIGHLHRRGIIYRDLKPENVLLDAEGHVKLGDFGLAKDDIENPTSGATSMCGTPEYMAPEVLSQIGHGFCVDYWGLGMLVYEMMTGLPPWYTTDRAKLFKRLKAAPLEVPSYFSPCSTDFVGCLLDRDPGRRLGVSGIRSVMEHSFFKTMQWKALLSKRIEAPIRPCDGWKALERNSNSKNHKTMETDVIDAATANFDKAFTRLPVETEDNNIDEKYSGSQEGSAEELREDTFVGFTFDEIDNAASTGTGGSSPQAFAGRH